MASLCREECTETLVEVTVHNFQMFCTSLHRVSTVNLCEKGAAVTSGSRELGLDKGPGELEHSVTPLVRIKNLVAVATLMGSCMQLLKRYRSGCHADRFRSWGPRGGYRVIIGGL